MAGFRRLYGSSPLHLAGHLVMFFVAGWAINQILGGGNAINWAAWFLGAALLHDLVLLPIYSLLDRVLERGARLRPAVSERRPVVLINYVRVPATIAGILLLVYFPVILGYASANYRNDTGHNLTGSTRNWLLVSAALFLGSALIYVVRVMRGRGSPPAPRSAASPPPSGAGDQPSG